MLFRSIYYKTVDQGYDNFFKIFKEIKDVEKIKLAQEELKIGIELIQKDFIDFSLLSFCINSIPILSSS